MKIDFHAHILPKADHGCGDSATSAAQLTLAQRAGVELIVATPHFYPNAHTIEQFLARQHRGAELLHEVWHETFPKVILGAEVLLLPGLDRMEGVESLCIQGTKHVILLELPEEVTQSAWETVYRMQRRGFHPVLAHLNRYSSEVVVEALEQGLNFQINAEAFSSLFSRKKWVALAESPLACALGSDLHQAPGDGYRAYEKALHTLGARGETIMKRAQKILDL